MLYKAFGLATAYEIECETEIVEEAKALAVQLLES
jgi:hypothetical protein